MVDWWQMDALIHFYFKENPNKYSDNTWCYKYKQVVFLIENNIVNGTVEFK